MGRPGAKTNSNKLTIENKNVYNKQKKKNYYQPNKFYVGNANEGHGFSSIQKKRFLSKFRRKFKKNSSKENLKDDQLEIKPLADDTLKSNLFAIPETNSSLNLNSTTGSSLANISTLTKKVAKKRASTTLERIEIDYEAIEKERAEKAEELKAKLTEHNDTVKRNIEKRKKITKKLAKRTKRGQPVMANRMEHILNKLKNA